MLSEQLATFLDALVGDQEVQILPRRLGELGLGIELVHDLEIGGKPGDRLVERGSRDAASGGLGP